MSRDWHSTTDNTFLAYHWWALPAAQPTETTEASRGSLLCLEAFSLTLLIRLCPIDSFLVISSRKNKKQCISVHTHLKVLRYFGPFPFHTIQQLLPLLTHFPLPQDNKINNFPSQTSWWDTPRGTFYFSELHFLNELTQNEHEPPSA